MQNSFRSEFNKEWPRTIMDSLLPYKKFHIINGFEMAKYVKSGEDLLQKNVYCGIFMAQAGKQFSVVDFEGDIFVQKDLVKFREEKVY